MMGTNSLGMPPGVPPLASSSDMETVLPVPVGPVISTACEERGDNRQVARLRAALSRRHTRRRTLRLVSSERAKYLYRTLSLVGTMSSEKSVPRAGSSYGGIVLRASVQANSGASLMGWRYAAAAPTHLIHGSHKLGPALEAEPAPAPAPAPAPPPSSPRPDKMASKAG